MQHGAQPSDSVKQVLGSLGTWDRWGRLKAGEPLEAILDEAKGAFPAVDPRTDRPDKVGGRPSKRARAKAESESAEAAPPAVAEAPATGAAVAATEVEMEAKPAEAPSAEISEPEAMAEAAPPEPEADEPGGESPE